MTLNRVIYNRLYNAQGLGLKAASPYDAEMIGIRMGYNEKFGVGKDVLDLCCGSGAYLLPLVPKVKSAIGLDFSRSLLACLQRELDEGAPLPPGHLRLIEGDAQQLPLRDEIVDYVYSYCSLYYLPHLDRSFAEISRVLRPGGVAALECGNLWSLNYPVNLAFHAESGWAKPFLAPYYKLRAYLKRARLQVVEHRVFQILPMYGTPRRLLPLMPLLSPRWKSLLGRKAGGKMLDEWLSGSWPLRHFAFRHLFLVRKA
jgi:ubiquinone/menaquinone biosynthesis C-methylase UbiE